MPLFTFLCVNLIYYSLNNVAIMGFRARLFSNGYSVLVRSSINQPGIGSLLLYILQSNTVIKGLALLKQEWSEW